MCTAMAVDLARQEWSANKEDELNRVLESASSQLVEQFEEQKKEALEKAIGEARVSKSIGRLINRCIIRSIRYVVCNRLFPP